MSPITKAAVYQTASKAGRSAYKFSKKNPKLIRGILIGAGVGIAVLIGRAVLKKFIEEIKRGKTERGLFDKDESGKSSEKSNASQVATQLYQAIHKNDWFGWSEDEARILELAYTINDWKETVSAYKNLYKKDLLADLQKALNQQEYEMFINRVKNN